MFIRLRPYYLTMFDVDYFYITDLTSKVLADVTKLRSQVLPIASLFYAEKVNRLYYYVQNLHVFFSGYNIESVKTLNQIRAHFNAVLINLQHLENLGDVRTKSLVKTTTNSVNELRGAFERFGIA